jgi:hypothetical protein
VDRHDGHHAEPRSPYADWLRAQGYDSADPWTDYVISAQKPDGEVVSGWHMRNAGLPARVAEPHSGNGLYRRSRDGLHRRAGR